MANNKIVDREVLKAFRQANDTRYQNGSVVVGKSLTAKQLEPVSEESGSEQTAPFLLQATGTNNNTTETPTSPVAKHLELRGNGVKWNQLGKRLSATNYNDESGNRSFDTNENSSIYTFETDTVGLGARLLTLYNVNLVSGHKVLIKLNITSSQSIPNDLFGLFISKGWSIYSSEHYALNANESKDIYCIFDVPNDTVEGTLQIRANYRSSGTWLQGTTIKYKDVQIIDISNSYGAGKEPTSVLAFNRDDPLPYYSYNAGELKSCSSSKLVTIGCNQLSALDTFIKVIAGQTYELSGVSVGGYVEEYDFEQKLIKTSSEITSTTQIELTNNTHYVKVQATTYSNAMFRLYWGESHEYVPYEKHEYNLPTVELRSVGSVYDTITPNGVYTQRIGVRAYESGDENNTSVLTDLTNTYYVLETPIVSEVSSFAENIIVDDFGTMEFVPSDSTEEVIVPQGNKFFYPADYVLFLDDMYNRSKDGGETSDANNFVTQSELQSAISDIPAPDVEGTLNVINASDITSNTLSAEQYALIRNGKPTLIKGTFLNMLNPILLTSSYLEAFGMIIGANSSGNYTAIKYYEIYASGSNYIIQIYGNKRIEFSNLYSINGKEIPNYPSNTGTFVLKCVNGTLTWVAE